MTQGIDLNAIPGGRFVAVGRVALNVPYVYGKAKDYIGPARYRWGKLSDYYYETDFFTIGGYYYPGVDAHEYCHDRD